MPIITLEDLKAHLGITASTQDSSLTVIVNSTNTFIENYCHRSFDENEYTELYDGTGTTALILNHTPVTEIDSIYVIDDEIELRDAVDETGYYYKDLSAGIIFNNDVWDRGRGIITVTYTAGYDDETMPADLKYAALEVASFFWNTKAKAGILSESLGSYSYRIANGLENLGNGFTIPSASAQIILDKYKENYFPTLVY